MALGWMYFFNMVKVLFIKSVYVDYKGGGWRLFPKLSKYKTNLYIIYKCHYVGKVEVVKININL